MYRCRSLRWTRINPNEWTSGSYAIKRWTVQNRYGKQLQYAALCDGLLIPHQANCLDSARHNCDNHRQLALIRSGR